MSDIAGARESTPHIGHLAADHRPRVAEILRSTGMFREDEVEVALELFDEGVGGTGNGERGTTAEGAAPHSPFPIPDYELLGLFDPADTLCGFACFGPTPDTDRTYDLYWIAVHAAARGSGGGTTLLNEVEQRLRERRARMLVIETSSRSDYAATRGFYLRRGYVEAARVGHFYAPDDDRIIYTKRLMSLDHGAGVAS